jgi:cobalt/nickel transport system permease protein
MSRTGVNSIFRVIIYKFVLHSLPLLKLLKRIFTFVISINSAIIDLKRLELLAGKETPIHSLDARAKVLVTIAFIFSVVSCDRYELAPLVPFFIFPAIMIALSGLPPVYLARKVALICPLVLMVGLFNPVFDRATIYEIGSFGISGGWISLASLFIRSLLTVGAACILIGTTGFTGVCQALERMGVPQLFAVQLLFLHRYIFVLADEVGRASRARELRSCGKKGLGVSSFGSLTGHLLLRTWQRAERIHTAMMARGFVGLFHAHRQTRFGASEISYVIGWTSLFTALRVFDIPGTIGALVTGILP